MACRSAGLRKLRHGQDHRGETQRGDILSTQVIRGQPILFCLFRNAQKRPVMAVRHQTG